MSSWTERGTAVVEAADLAGTAPMTTPELRTGDWTRWGDAGVLGDAVTEHTLSRLAESARETARAQGYAVGWAQGQQAARAEVRAEAAAGQAARAADEQRRVEEHRAALAALESAASRLQEAMAAVCTGVEESATGLAWQLTEELVGRELAATSGAEVVRRALALAPREPVVAVHLHPADAATLEEEPAGIRVVADSCLQRGDALVALVEGVVDARVSTALERVREALA